MVAISSSANTNNQASALTSLQPVAAEAVKVRSEHSQTDHSWLSDLVIEGSNDNVDDFIYDSTGKLSKGDPEDPVNFWETPTSTDETGDVIGAAPVATPWTQTFSSVDHFKTALRSYLRQKVASPEVQEALRNAAIMTPEKQALKDGVVRGTAPERADDMVKMVSMLNEMIKASHSEHYKENEDYRESVDTRTAMFKRIITNDYGYLKRETEMSAPPIFANDDGTYSLPNFTISDKGEVLYTHTS